MTTLGIIIGNRGFFPAHLCESGRRDILRVLEEEGIKAVTLPVEASRFGAVESLVDAHKCADLFKAHREEIDGVLVTLPNFGDERAVANTVRYSEKLLEASGITVETLDLSEALGWVRKMKEDDPELQAKLSAIQGYTNVRGIPPESLMKMAKLGVAIDRWVKDKQLSATA